MKDKHNHNHSIKKNLRNFTYIHQESSSKTLVEHFHQEKFQKYSKFSLLQQVRLKFQPSNPR
jgi:hypothetical protein